MIKSSSTDPAKHLNLEQDKRRKKLLSWRQRKYLADNARKDVPIPVTIRAFAIDDKKKIAVDREVVFFYPRADMINKKEK